MLKTSLCVVTAMAMGCSGDGSGGGRDPSKLSEVEATHQRGSTTTVERTTLTYDGARLVEVAKVINGGPSGRSTFTYGPAGIERISTIDKDGDRATQQFTYEEKRLKGIRYEVVGVYVNDRTMTYDEANSNRVTEVSVTETWMGGTPQTSLTRFEYDPTTGRTAKLSTIGFDLLSSTELRYSPDGLLERATSFAGTSHVETYNFSYSEDAKLDEIVDTNNGHYTVAYDPEGRVSEVRWFAQGQTDTYRYTYAKGDVSGLTFAPALPVAELFDLAGASFSTISLEQWGPEIIDVPSDDIESAD